MVSIMYGAPVVSTDWWVDFSRREKRHRRTVGKVLLVNAERMKEHMGRSRAAFLGLTTEAIETVRQAMKKGNVHIAY